MASPTHPAPGSSRSNANSKGPSSETAKDTRGSKRKSTRSRPSDAPSKKGKAVQQPKAKQQGVKKPACGQDQGEINELLKKIAGDKDLRNALQAQMNNSTDAAIVSDEDLSDAERRSSPRQVPRRQSRRTSSAQTTVKTPTHRIDDDGSGEDDSDVDQEEAVTFEADDLRNNNDDSANDDDDDDADDEFHLNDRPAGTQIPNQGESDDEQEVSYNIDHGNTTDIAAGHDSVEVTDADRLPTTAPIDLTTLNHEKP